MIAWLFVALAAADLMDPRYRSTCEARCDRRHEMRTCDVDEIKGREACVALEKQGFLHECTIEGQYASTEVMCRAEDDFQERRCATSSGSGAIGAIVLLLAARRSRR